MGFLSMPIFPLLELCADEGGNKMVGAKGFELGDKIVQVIGKQSSYVFVSSNCAQIDSQGSDTGDYELARIVAVWEDLPMEVKQAVCAIVDLSR